ncbi:Protein sidekick-1 [Amphibalanus amphitrite]|uniref:Protein sidekick-1 n=1 Tax=Amphibalanus amphitrite TaxID=1232801 RepID=A0A6A4WPR1_AMPAM|nr:Protein sidekick-1 [Amphibalanus amphitrite]
MAHRQPLASHLHGAFRLIARPYGKSGLWPSVEAGQRTVSNHTNITISGLTPFTVYTFRVVAINALGHSRPSTVSYPVNTQRERPGTAPNLTFARNRSSTSIEVGWEPPANYTLHGEFTGYRLTYRPVEPSRTPGTVTEVDLHDIWLRADIKADIYLQASHEPG